MERKELQLEHKYQQAGGHSVFAALHSVLTLGGMSYMSGSQSPFHRTPQHPHGGIHLRSARACTLRSGESVAGERRIEGQGSRPSRQTEKTGRVM